MRKLGGGGGGGLEGVDTRVVKGMEPPVSTHNGIEFSHTLYTLEKFTFNKNTFLFLVYIKFDILKVQIFSKIMHL